MAPMTKAGRDRLPASSYGWPEKQLYPITSQSDVNAAARLIGKAPASERARIKSRITAIAKRKGWKIPDAWQTDSST